MILWRLPRDSGTIAHPNECLWDCPPSSDWYGVSAGVGSWCVWRGAAAQSTVDDGLEDALGVGGDQPDLWRGPPSRVVRAVQHARYRLWHRPGGRRAGRRGAEVGGL